MLMGKTNGGLEILYFTITHLLLSVLTSNVKILTIIKMNGNFIMDNLFFVGIFTSLKIQI